MIEEKHPAMLVIPAGFGEAITSGQSTTVRLVEQPSDSILSIEQSMQTAARQLGFAYSIAKATTEKADVLQNFNGAESRTLFSILF